MMPAVLYSKGYFSLEMPALKYRLVCICPVQICMHNNNNKVDQHCIAILLPTHTYWCVCVCACICIVRLFIAFLCNRPGLLNIDFTQFSLLESISSIFSVHFAFLSFLCLLVFLSQMPTCMLRLSAFNSFVIIYSLSAFVATLFVLTVSNDRTTWLDIMT